jgi:hypothetical protein
MTAVSIAPGVAYGQNSQSNASERTIVGAWRTQVTLLNCDTGEPGPSLRGLFTFHEGGTRSEWGVAPGSTPAARSPSHGVWAREHGWQDYSFVFTHYRYNARGGLIGSQRVTATLELDDDGDHFTTQSGVEVLDVDDNVIGRGCATAAGTRIELVN